MIQRSLSVQLYHIQSLVEQVGGELKIDPVQVSGYPMKLVASINHVTLTLNEEGSDNTVIFETPLMIKHALWEKSISITFPQRITNIVGKARHTLIMAAPAVFSLQLDGQPLVIGLTSLIHHLPVQWEKHVQNIQWVVPEGTLYEGTSSDTPMVSWHPKTLSLSLRTSAQQKKVSGRVTSEGFTIQAGYLDSLTQAVPEPYADKIDLPAWQTLLTLMTSNVSLLNNTVFHLKTEAEITQLLNPFQYQRVEAAASLTNAHWEIQMKAEMSHEPKTDLTPFGSGKITIEQYPMLFTFLHDLYPYVQLLKMPAWPVLDETYYQTLMSILEAIGKQSDYQSLAFQIERQPQGGLTINGVLLTDIQTQIHDRILNLKKIQAEKAAAAARPTAPVLSPEELKAQKEARIKKWIERYENNREQMLKDKELEDQAYLQHLEDMDSMEKTKIQAQLLLEKSNQMMESIQLFQHFQKDRHFAQP